MKREIQRIYGIMNELKYKSNSKRLDVSQGTIGNNKQCQEKSTTKILRKIDKIKNRQLSQRILKFQQTNF